VIVPEQAFLAERNRIISNSGRKPIHRRTRPNGDSEDGYFTDFGVGVQCHPPAKSTISGTWLISHQGEA
jgi:hypothetical protein